MNEKLEKEKSVKSFQEILLKCLKIIYKNFLKWIMSRAKIVLNFIIWK